MKALFDLQDVWNIVSNGYKESESDATFERKFNEKFCKIQKRKTKRL